MLLDMAGNGEIKEHASRQEPLEVAGKMKLTRKRDQKQAPFGQLSPQNFERFSRASGGQTPGLSAFAAPQEIERGCSNSCNVAPEQPLAGAREDRLAPLPGHSPRGGSADDPPEGPSLDERV